MAPNMGQTLPLAPRPSGAPSAAPPPVPPSPPPAPPAPPVANPALSAKPALRGTMIGMAPPDLQKLQVPGARLGGTMIGMAPGSALGGTLLAAPGAPPSPPGAHAAPDANITEYGAPWTDPAGATSPPDPALAAPLRRTILGVARPGIAPMNPGQSKAAPAAPPPPPPVPAAPTAWQAAGYPAPPAAAYEALPVRPVTPARTRRIPALAALSIVAAAALFTAAAVALVLYRSRGAIEAKLGMDAEGREQLQLVCHGCDNGVKAKLGNVTTTFQSGRAALLLDRKLPVGPNRVSVELERTPGRSESVELAFPVEYRVRADISGLEQTPPRILVRVQALTGTAVVVDGKPVVLGADGSASAEVSVANELTGSDAGLRSLERRVAYAITPPGGAPESGEVSVRIGITPLLVQAPGSSIVIDSPTFVLSGRTAKNASVTVEGRAITVDVAGAFAQIMSVSAPGETNVLVRASAPEQAPRLVPIRVRRVESLAAEAAAVRAKATTAFAGLDDPDSKRGVAVALDGAVIEARSENFTSVLLLDVKSGCSAPPCLARVSLGQKLAFSEGELVSVFGALIGSVEGPKTGTRIPAIQADFVVRGKK